MPNDRKRGSMPSANAAGILLAQHTRRNAVFLPHYNPCLAASLAWLRQICLYRSF